MGMSVRSVVIGDVSVNGMVGLVAEVWCVMVLETTGISVMTVAIGGIVSGVTGLWQRCDVIADGGGGGQGDGSGSANGRSVISILAILAMKMMVMLSFSQQKLTEYLHWPSLY